MRHTMIVSAARTPVGSFQGALASVPGTKLGSIAIKAAVERSGLKPADVQEVYMGCVLTAAIGQAPARQAALGAGLPIAVPCTTIGKVCGSGLRSVAFGAAAIAAEDADVIVAGGMESMSNAPYALTEARSGYRMGHGKIIDTMIKDGLWDVYKDIHMGSAADMCAKTKGYTREKQDAFAIESYKRSLKAIKDGVFKDEIVAVGVPQKKGGEVMVDTDEEPGRGDIEKMPKLRPAFDKEGTVTAGNASSINDGGAAMVLVAEDAVSRYKVQPLARIVGYASAAREPEWFTLAPVDAIRKALDKYKLRVNDIDVWEINEAFAVVTLAAMDEFKIPHDKVNIYGGACAIGHPIGASGARITVTLLNALKRTGGKRGLATLCIGGGEAMALIVERV
jgi:acetyl-CoA C-acetyltransferase